jgi:hypothetical protein
MFDENIQLFLIIGTEALSQQSLQQQMITEMVSRLI